MHLSSCTLTPSTAPHGSSSDATHTRMLALSPCLCPSVSAPALGAAACLTRMEVRKFTQAIMGSPSRHVSTSAHQLVEPCLVGPELSLVQQPQSRLSSWAQQLLGRPAFHLQPLHQGWINDPNGVHYDPRTKLYHMFYQHFETGAVWRWGLSWGHACSRDLLTWHDMPPILKPTPDGPDSDGVWSGCAFPTPDGTVILNTAVRLRSTTKEEHLPPSAHDLGLQMIESQCCAIANPTSDPLLTTWCKGAAPLLPLPPSKNLSGWRDPFLVGRPGDGMHEKWTILVGAGYTGGPGTALVYTSDSPTSGWELAGELCSATGYGTMWECPLLAKVPRTCHPNGLTNGNGQQSDTHMLVVCPDNAHHAPVYFLGDYKSTELKFDLPSATHAAPLDLGGPTFYAPNLLTNDPSGRLVMWGWCQELGRPAGEFDSACCLSQPRVISLHPEQCNRIWQEPLGTLPDLRMSSWISAAPMSIRQGVPVSLDAAADSQHMEIEVTLQRPQRRRHSRVCKTAVLLKPAVPVEDVPVGEASGRHGAALLFDWDTHCLEMVYSDGSVCLEQLAALPAARYQAMNSASVASVAPPSSPAPVRTPPHASGASLVDADLDEVDEPENDIERRAVNIAGCHMVGGRLYLPETGPEQDQLTLRVFLDHSLLEVFTSTGQVLTTRVYPANHTAPSQATGPAPHLVQLASFGCTSTITHCAVHHMDAIWESPEALASLEQELQQVERSPRSPVKLPLGCREAALPSLPSSPLQINGTVPAATC